VSIDNETKPRGILWVLERFVVIGVSTYVNRRDEQQPAKEKREQATVRSADEHDFARRCVRYERISNLRGCRANNAATYLVAFFAREIKKISVVPQFEITPKALANLSLG